MVYDDAEVDLFPLSGLLGIAGGGHACFCNSKHSQNFDWRNWRAKSTILRDIYCRALFGVNDGVARGSKGIWLQLKENKPGRQEITEGDDATMRTMPGQDISYQPVLLEREPHTSRRIYQRRSSLIEWRRKENWKKVFVLCKCVTSCLFCTCRGVLRPLDGVKGLRRQAC